MTALTEATGHRRPTGIAAQISGHLDGADDNLTLIYYGDESWDAVRLRDAVAQFGAAFARVERPLRVAAVMRNHPWHVAVLSAVLSGGHCLLLLSPLEPAARTLADVRKLRPDVLIGEPDDLTADLRSAAASSGALVVTLPRPGDLGAVVLGDGRPPPTGEPSAPDVAVLMLTSGTTGPAKRVPVRYADLDHAVSGAEQHYVGRVVVGRRKQGVICPLMPVTISGLWSLVTALVGGAPVVLLDRFQPEPWADAVERHQPRTVNLPPAALRMILDAQIAPERLRSVTSVWSGAAPLDPALGRAFEERYGVPVLQSYGATEFTGGLAGWSLVDWKQWGPAKRGSVGRLHPAVEGRVLDPETAALLAAGETGVLCFRTPHSVGVGATDWVRTNDLGRIDGDGFLFVEGRIDDVINRGGFKVSAGRLKSVLESHPSVREAAVVPLPDARLGQTPGALVVLCDDPAGPADRAALEKHVRDQLPPYYVPTVLRFAAELPRNGAMKIIRPAVVTLLTSA